MPAAHERMVAAVRNAGRPGVAASAIAAVDAALWDLKARLCDLPLVDLLGAVRDQVPVYASAGFTSYSSERLREQVAGWVEAGHRAVKIEEPVSSDDLEGLRLLRDRAPAGMEITAGEYGYDPFYFRRMLAAGAVDVLMADATPCAGITGFLRVAALCVEFGLPLSSHTAPALHLHAGCAAPNLRHLEWFHDHVLCERELFDGVVEPVGGVLQPDRSRPGHGLALRERYAA